MRRLLPGANRQINDIIRQLISHINCFFHMVLQHRPQRRGNMRQHHAQPFLANALQGRIGQTGAQLLFGFPGFRVQIKAGRRIKRVIPIQHRHGIGVGIAKRIQIGARQYLCPAVRYLAQFGKPRQAHHLIGKITQSRQHRYFSLQCHQTSSIGLPFIILIMAHATPFRLFCPSAHISCNASLPLIFQHKKG